MLTGGCFCGAVRYEAWGEPSHLTNCHCSICRRTTGAPYVAWFTVQRSAFRFTQGQPTRFRSSAQGARCFCPTCGTQLTFEYSDSSDQIDITTCSLDDPESLPPADHIHVSSKLSWVALADGLPASPQARTPV